MSDSGLVQRTHVTVKVAVETTGLTRAQHDQNVRYAITNLLNANRAVEKAFITTVAYDDDGNKIVGFTGTGGSSPPDETTEIINDLVTE